MDPCSHVVRYVGKSQDIGRRYAQHLGSNGGKIWAPETARARWIGDLALEGLSPGLVVLSAVNTLAEKNEWIEAFRLVGGAEFNWRAERV